MFTLMVEHFGDAVLGKTPLLYPPQDAFHNMRVIDACFESIRTGRAVHFLGSSAKDWETERG
jgi:predicted dehydrogenase